MIATQFSSICCPALRVAGRAARRYGKRAAGAGAAARALAAVIVETFRRVEIKHAVRLKSFRAMQSFHAMRNFHVKAAGAVRTPRQLAATVATVAAERRHQAP